jgi:protoporphyrinogen/coproporphyrinogen III oxidase
VAALLPHLERVEPGIGELIEFADVSRWSPAALNAVPGTHRTIAEIERLTDARDPIQLAGDYRRMPSVNGSIVSGESAASRIADTLRHRTT